MMLLLVTILAVLLAVIMSVFAWRVAYEERRRSAARVAALAADIQSDTELYPAAATPLQRSSAPLFAAARARRDGTRFAVAMAAGVLAFAPAAALAVVFGGAPRATAVGAATPENAVAGADAAAPSLVPLELLALGHEREGDRLIVRGVVRNPSSGGSIE